MSAQARTSQFRAALNCLLAVTLALSCVDARPKEAAQGPALAPVPAKAAAAVQLEVFAEGLDQPLGMAFASGDPAKRLFVVEKGGLIRVVKKGSAPVAFLDLSSRVSRGSEQGLLGLAFHNEFMKNGRLFVNYTDKKGDTRIVELTVAAPTTERATIQSERELLQVDQPYGNHNGGNLVMTPAGWLLVGLGDGGSGGDPRENGQNPKSLLGKMLRIDPDAAGEGATAKILAIGMRNPWRYALDRANRDLYIGDVGQNQWEEVDVVALDALDGKNFGWNRMEGAHCFKGSGCDTAGLALPVAEYGHDVGCSITGGVVYRGRAIPSLEGLYFYADYCTSFLRSLRFKRDTRAVDDHWDWKAALDPKSQLSQIASFGEDEAGEVYVISLAGTIWRLAPRS